MKRKIYIIKRRDSTQPLVVLILQMGHRLLSTFVREDCISERTHWLAAIKLLPWTRHRVPVFVRLQSAHVAPPFATQWRRCKRVIYTEQHERTGDSSALHFVFVSRIYNCVFSSHKTSNNNSNIAREKAI